MENILFLFFIFGYSNWTDVYNGQPDSEYSGVLDESIIPIAQGNIWFHNCVASSFNSQLLNVDERETDYNLLIEECFFEDFKSYERGGVIYWVNRGNLTMKKICVYNIDSGATSVTGSFAFTVYSQYYVSELISLYCAPGPGQEAMASLNMLANNAKVTFINSTLNTAISVGAQINIWAIFSYSNFKSHHTKVFNTEYIFLCINTDLMFSNFINNTIEYEGGSIYTTQQRDTKVYCGVAGCSFINNTADYICRCIAEGQFFLTDCYIDEGTLNNGKWTNMVYQEQLIYNKLYATKGICLTPGSDELAQLSSSTPPLMTPIPTNPPSFNTTTIAGETLKITTIAAASVSGVGLIVTVIWFVKKVFKKVIKYALKKQLFPTDSEEEEEEEEEDEYSTEKIGKNILEDSGNGEAQAKHNTLTMNGSRSMDHLTSFNSFVFKASDERDTDSTREQGTQENTPVPNPENKRIHFHAQSPQPQIKTPLLELQKPYSMSPQHDLLIPTKNNQKQMVGNSDGSDISIDDSSSY